MRTLTHQDLEDAMMKSGVDSVKLSTYWSIVYRAQIHGNIGLREALHRVRGQHEEISVFVGQVLNPSDLDDVVYVIDALQGEKLGNDSSGANGLRMLCAWRARVLMQVVVDKRNRLLGGRKEFSRETA